MKGYKAFEHDFTCRGFQYEVGKEYETEETIALCKTGFHFCKNIADCFNYYPQVEARFAEVEAYGEVIEADDDSKCVTNKIRILREIPREEAVDMSNTGNCNTGNCNTGDWNTGDCNTGNRNTGNRNTGNCNTGNCNTGNRNTGNRNTGDWNTGDWNTGDCNTGDWNLTSFSSGCFNTKEPKIFMFDKPSEMTYHEWIQSDARALLNKIPRNIVEWVDSSRMTDTEKALHPEHKTIGGYLKILDESENAQTWWNGLKEDDQNTIKSLPNFDAEIFEKCTGIKVDM